MPPLKKEYLSTNDGYTIAILPGPRPPTDPSITLEEYERGPPDVSTTFDILLKIIVKENEFPENLSDEMLRKASLLFYWTRGEHALQLLRDAGLATPPLATWEDTTNIAYDGDPDAMVIHRLLGYEGGRSITKEQPVIVGLAAPWNKIFNPQVLLMESMGVLIWGVVGIYVKATYDNPNSCIRIPLGEIRVRDIMLWRDFRAFLVKVPGFEHIKVRAALRERSGNFQTKQIFACVVNACNLRPST